VKYIGYVDEQYKTVITNKIEYKTRQKPLWNERGAKMRGDKTKARVQNVTEGGKGDTRYIITNP